ncbi:MAG: cysteine desulfurase-like protein [Bacillota bacterium]|nr:cysteine desulfurase-like protein [Bacillota bacterium]MDW7676244.1 cysteine desulfurase-like protein [Bacillota bacterium]
MSLIYDVQKIRKQFPALERQINGQPAVYLDGPGGTQVPQRVADKVTEYLLHHNANAHGNFITSRESDALHESAREVLADFLGCHASEIMFGDSSSTNNIKLALALARDLEEGDEIIITDLDHESNRSPWRHLEERGLLIKRVKVNPEDCTMNQADFQDKLSDKTKVVALNWASNGVGTITDIKPMIEKAHEAGALTIVDAVHYAPHRPIDVKETGMDFLVCSTYKFFGPHMGVMYARHDLMEKLRTYRVLVEDNGNPPQKFETGTPQFESICGSAEAVEFIAAIGQDCDDWAAANHPEWMKGLTGRRRQVVAGMLAIDAHEEPLAKKLRTALRSMPKVKVYGPREGEPRTSTVSFLIEGMHAESVAAKLGEQGIFVWDGHYYARELINNTLDLEAVGGLVRIGLAPYTTEQEIDRTIAAIGEIAAE